MRANSVLTASVLQILAIVVQTWLLGFDLSLFATGATMWAIWLGVSLTAAGTSLLARQAFGRGGISRNQAGILIVLGALFGFAFPVSVTASLQLPDVIAGWTSGPALPTWQGVLTMMIGFAAFFQGQAARGSEPRREGERGIMQSSQVSPTAQP